MAYNHVQHVVSVNEFRGLADLNGLVGSSDGDSVYVAGYYESINDAPWVKGGGHFVWDSTKLRSEHNGVTIFSPTVHWDGTQETLADYHAGTWEIDPDGVGCWVREYDTLNVHMAGAIGDGVADDKTALESAVSSVEAANNIAGVEGTGIPRADMCIVSIPAGTYHITSEIDTGNRDVVWIVNQAAIIPNYIYLNGEILRIGQRQNTYHHGTTDYACTYSMRSNIDLEAGAEVLGISSASSLNTYSDRDSVTLYIDNTAPTALVDASSATYTSTTVTIAAPSTSILRRYRRGMIVDTKHAPKWSGIVDFWSADGSVITVTAWYRVGGGGVASTPTNDGTGCVLNGFTKVWAHNANIFLTPTSYAKKASGFELGVLNNKGALDYVNEINYIWGYDAVSLGAHDGAAGFIARPSSTSKFYRAFEATDATETAYHAEGTPTYGFWSEQTSGTPFRYTNNETLYFQVDVNGNITARSLSCTFVNSNLSLGNPVSASTPFIDFNSSGNNIDYDVRLLASGGTGSVGNGVLTCTAGGGFISAGSVRPSGDNQVSSGAATFRWANVYGAQFRPGGGAPIWTSGSGTPEGVVIAPVGSLFTRTDGGAGTTLYVKESGSGNTGWIAK